MLLANIVAAGAVDREFNYIVGSNWGGEPGGGAAPPRTPLHSGGLRPPDPPYWRFAPQQLALHHAEQSWGQNLFQNSVFLNKSADWTSLHHLNSIWLSWTSSTPKKIRTAIPPNMVCLTAPHLFSRPDW